MCKPTAVVFSGVNNDDLGLVVFVVASEEEGGGRSRLLDAELWQLRISWK